MVVAARTKLPAALDMVNQLGFTIGRPMPIAESNLQVRLTPVATSTVQSRGVSTILPPGQKVEERDK
ncbi:hypothetical protein E2C01_054377 [Portunus trituberculatus]|uniref:Uncharacterized protein n=1 Tax=Portunus trituberculatus TaxID=210409 RepID=A0A5B7GRT6_PORTR|nr:hypothetical protein [Portunus trituberculatus]